MSKNNRVFMHKNAMDVALLVIAELDAHKVVGRWINLGYTGHPWFVPVDVIEVELTPDWIDVTDKLETARIKPGVPH